MRKLALLLALLGSALSAWAAKGVSVADLERILNADRGKPDAQVAELLSGLELTERLSAATRARLESLSPGTNTTLELKLLADQSEFLPLPNAEVPPLPAPDFAEQRKIMALVVNYVGKTINQLPNFYATRVTTSFEEWPQTRDGTRTTLYRPLHQTSATEATVLYRDGREMVETAKNASDAVKPPSKGLNAWGVFGPIITTVFLDAARSNLSWSHWEQLPSGSRAVFHYAVPQQTSHYRATYCCIPGLDPRSPQGETFDRVVGYHGDISVDPHDGSILRLTVESDLKPSDPIQRADIMVEYGPVDIGGKTYICATRSVALSSALSVSRFNRTPGMVGRATAGPPQTLLNDVAFERYHMFRAGVRILTADETQEQGPPPDAPSSTPAASEVAQALPTPEPTKEAETLSATPATPIVDAVPTPAPSPTPATATNTSNLDQPTLFKVTTRQVIVDVVANKADGQPLVGLGKQDFEIKENGKPQTINFFQEHTQSAAAQTAPPEMPAMPAGARTNVPPAPPGDAVNVLLIDTLNTEVQDQAAVRHQVIDVLTKMPQGPRFAIFVLGSQLRCLQGFTSDASALLAALNDPRNGLKSKKDGTFESRSDHADTDAHIAELQVEQASPFAIQALQAALAEAGGRDIGARASMTYEALMYLGHYLSGIPGRKNLIWFSGSFPIVVVPTEEQLAGLKKNSAHPEVLARVKQTAELFTASQIAVYPISAEGLMMDHVGEASAFAADGSGGHMGSQSGSAMSPYSAGAGERAATTNAMDQLAASTGGKAYYNTNDLGAALKNAIDNGAHYYTLGYSPSDKNMDGTYRKIDIKSVHGRNKLEYRRGYIASETTLPAPKAKVDPLAPLLRLGLPGATGILYGVHAEPAEDAASLGEPHAGQNPNLIGATTRYKVDFVVRSQDLALQQDAQGNWNGKLLLGLKAYDHEGNAVNWQAEEETLTLKPDQLDSLRKTGITAHLNIDVPAVGQLHLITAVYDLTSGTGGTLEITLQAPRK